MGPNLYPLLYHRCFFKKRDYNLVKNKDSTPLTRIPSEDVNEMSGHRLRLDRSSGGTGKNKIKQVL